MTRSIRVNGTRLRRAIEDQGLAERAFCRTTAVGQTALRSMINDNIVQSRLTIADIASIINEAGLTFAQLFDTPTEPADDAPDSDLKALGQLLHAQSTRQPEHRIAAALVWDLQRLRDTIAALDAHLTPLGLRVHTNSVGVTIQAADDDAREVAATLARYRDADSGLDASQARVAYAIYAGHLSKTRIPAYQLWHLGRLSSRGMVGYAKNGRPQLTNDLLYCLDPDR